MLAATSVDCHRAALLLSLAVVGLLRVTSEQHDVTTTRYRGDESSDVNVTSSTHAQYVNPRPGRSGNILIRQRVKVSAVVARKLKGVKTVNLNISDESQSDIINAPLARAKRLYRARVHRRCPSVYPCQSVATRFKAHVRPSPYFQS